MKLYPLNVKTNIDEAINSIKANKLRSIITAMIIALGITALIGILTTIDGIKNSISSNLNSMGSNTFNIQINSNIGRRSGKKQKRYPPITYRQALEFKKNYSNGTVSLKTLVTSVGQLKYSTKRTNPNVRVIGVDEHHVISESINLEKGRNFSKSEIEFGANVLILGEELSNKLFDQLNPIDKRITIFGQKFKVIAIIKKEGAMSNSGNDRSVLVPLNKARNLSLNNYTYDIKVSLAEEQKIDEEIGNATKTMRIVRKDKLGEESSFEIKKSDSLIQKINETSSTLRMGGFFISLIILLGASIALVNIMLVSVTERTKEIGVRKALGATPNEIKEQFLIEAIVICLLGGIGGIFIGLVLGNILSLLIGSKEFIIPWIWIFLGLIVCILVGILSGILPAIKASKLDPIESLRYE